MSRQIKIQAYLEISWIGGLEQKDIYIYIKLYYGNKREVGTPLQKVASWYFVEWTQERLIEAICKIRVGVLDFRNV